MAPPSKKKPPPSVASGEEDDEPPVVFELGSICAEFEQKEHFRFEFDGIFTKQDEEELFKTRRS
jgi:hypothetical protein